MPIVLAGLSPLLKGRDAIWVIGGMAGVVALCLIFLQPLLTAGAPALLPVESGHRWHRVCGTIIVAAVLLHVGALYAYSPDDIMDALTLTAPTPFSVYGVVSMWCVVLTALLAMSRRWLRLTYSRWRILHSVLAVAIVVPAIVHALLIEGAMEDNSKLIVCVAALIAVTAGVLEMNLFRPLRQRRRLQRA